MSWGLPHHPSMGGFPKVTTTARGLKRKPALLSISVLLWMTQKGSPWASSQTSDRVKSVSQPAWLQGLTPSGTYTHKKMEPGMNSPVHFPGWTGKGQLRSANSAKEAVNKCLGTASHKWSSTTSRAELAWFWMAHKMDREAYSCPCPSV